MPFPYQQPYQFQPPYQQMYQQYNQLAQQPVTQSGILWVSGLMEAQAYPIAPNNAVALWEKSGKTIYLKSADATGKPTMRVYDLVERAETTPDGVSPADGKTPAYATKDELGAVVGAVKGFDELIGSIKADIDSMKNDLYGIAGKKKPAKKKDEDDDE